MQPLAVRALCLLLLEVLVLLSIDNLLSSVKVGLVGLDALALGNEHVAEEKDDVERDAEISGDEVLVVELAGGGVDEDVEVLGQGDEDREEQADDSTPVALRGDVGHGAVGDVLRAASTEEEEVGDEDGDPGQDTEDGDEVDKVAKDLIKSHVSKELRLSSQEIQHENIPLCWR